MLTIQYHLSRAINLNSDIVQQHSTNMKLLFVTSLLSLGHVAFGALKTKPPLLGLCEYDCDVDADCKPGLWCADTHKPELKAAGFDERKANCGKIGAWNLEVCFDPAILKPSGGGGGGTCIITKTSFVSI